MRTVKELTDQALQFAKTIDDNVKFVHFVELPTATAMRLSTLLRDIASKLYEQEGIIDSFTNQTIVAVMPESLSTIPVESELTRRPGRPKKDVKENDE